MTNFSGFLSQLLLQRTTYMTNHSNLTNICLIYFNQFVIQFKNKMRIYDIF